MKHEIIEPVVVGWFVIEMVVFETNIVDDGCDVDGSEVEAVVEDVDLQLSVCLFPFLSSVVFRQWSTETDKLSKPTQLLVLNILI